jgi:predicted phosphoribosyltransferase
LATIIDDAHMRNRVRVFRNRFHAGRLLAEKMIEYKGNENAIVLAIPSGGIQVAYEISKRLELPLDLAITRKLHVPWNREAGFGAISWDGFMLLNEPLVRGIRLSAEEIEKCMEEEKAFIRRRIKKFRGDKPFPELRKRVCLVVDDGLASGFSMLVTLKTLKQRNVKEAVVAVPTAPERSIDLIKPHAKKVFCLNIRTGLSFTVADAYEVWYDLSDEEVLEFLGDQ